MILSKYTFLFDSDESGEKEFYAYNTLSNALLEIDGERYFVFFLQKYFEISFYFFYVCRVIQFFRPGVACRTRKSLPARKKNRVIVDSLSLTNRQKGNCKDGNIFPQNKMRRGERELQDVCREAKHSKTKTIFIHV